MDTTENTITVRPPWNKGKLVGQKTPFKLKERQKDDARTHMMRGQLRSLRRSFW